MTGETNAVMAQVQNFRVEYEKKFPGVNPQSEIQRLMNQGVITQAQFEAARKRAAAMGYNV